MLLKRKTDEKLGEILIKNGDLTKKELDEALEKQKKEGGLIGEVLIKLGFVNDIAIAKALTEQYNFPFISLENFDFNADALKLIPYEKARSYKIAALDVFGDLLVVAMVNPLDIAGIETIEKIAGKKIKAFVTSLSSFNSVIEKIYSVKK